MRPLTALLLGLVACSGTAAAQTTTPPPTQPPARRLPATKVVADTSNQLSVQNDRAAAVTVYVRSGKLDRRLGVVPAGAISVLALPSWATDGQQSITLFGRADGESFDLAAQTLALRGSRRLGMLIPPRGGIAGQDQLTVKLSAEELEATTITVENPRDKPVTVFAEQGTYSVRLGEIAAKDQLTLRVPSSLVGRDQSIRLFVRPAGGLDQVSQRISLKPGDHAGVRVSMF